MVRRGLCLALVTAVLGCVLIVVSGCGDSTATAQPSQQPSPAAGQTTPGWTGVGVSRVLGLYLKPGRPAAIEFQVSSSELQVFVLTQKPLRELVLFLRSPGPTGSSDDTLTVVPMQTSTRSFGGDLISSISTVKSLTPGVYRLVLKGTGEVSTIEMKQR
jgi:hypothetical protein